MAKQITKEKALKHNLRTFIVIEALAVIFFVVGLIIPAIQIIAILFAVSFVLGGFVAFSAGKKCILKVYTKKRYVQAKACIYTIAVTLAVRSHLFSYRTQKLSSLAPKILCWRRHGKIGCCCIQ